MRSKLSFTTINVSILEKQENMMGTLLGKIGLQYQPNNEYTKKTKLKFLLIFIFNISPWIDKSFKEKIKVFIIPF